MFLAASKLSTLISEGYCVMEHILLASFNYSILNSCSCSNSLSFNSLWILNSISLNFNSIDLIFSQAQFYFEVLNRKLIDQQKMK